MTGLFKGSDSAYYGPYQMPKASLVEPIATNGSQGVASQMKKSDGIHLGSLSDISSGLSQLDNADSGLSAVSGFVTLLSGIAGTILGFI